MVPVYSINYFVQSIEIETMILYQGDDVNDAEAPMEATIAGAGDPGALPVGKKPRKNKCVG